MPLKRTALAALLALFGAGLHVVQPASAQDAGIRLEVVVDGDNLNRALGLVDPGDGSGRLFVPTQSGQIRILNSAGALLPAIFLDISDRIDCCENERGLVGLAFHPKYRKNGYFYVVYVSLGNRTVVSRFEVTANRNVANPASEEEIISWKQPELPHNGGAIYFGPDGYLYLGAGDGGTRDSAQNLRSPLGSILRLDVDSDFPYAIPDDNPFVGVGRSDDEIFVYGLRNPWRFSFDHVTGDLFIGDVGANRWEEISYLAGGEPGGANFGWPIKEGPLCIKKESECADESLVAPIIAYQHEESQPCNSVTGGYRYRGPEVPTLPGFYVFGDFCRGQIFGAKQNSAGNWVVNELLDTPLQISSFGEDSERNLYAVIFRGGIMRVVGQNLFESDFESGDTLDWSQRRGDFAVVPGGPKRSLQTLEIAAGGVSFVRSKHPTGEKTFEVGFDLNVNRINLAGGSVEVLRLAGNGKKGHVRLVLEQRKSKYFLNLLARGNSGKFSKIGETRVPKARNVRIGLDWMAASGKNVGDGEVMLFKNGKLAVAAVNLDNDKRKISTATLGFPAGSKGANGALLFDNYVSTP